MPLQFNAALLLLFVKCFIFSNTFHLSYGQEELDLCENGGVCVEAPHCPSAVQAIKETHEHNLERCGWNHLTEKVCCLDEMSSSSSTDVPGTTTKKSESRGNVRKSDEACSRYATLVPFAVNFHISNGENAGEGEFPHMAALGYMDPDGGSNLLWICGASIISERYLITAAHCARGGRGRPGPIRVLVGVLNLTEESATRREYEIENITVHFNHSRVKGLNDIAVIRVASDITFNDRVYPACLYTKSDDPRGLIITGWGKLFLGQDIRSDTLQKARVEAVPLTSCNETYVRKLTRVLNPGQICANSSDRNMPTDSCQGDSGGPLQIFNTVENSYAVVGIISFGILDCGGTDPAVYTRVYYYLDWIESIVWP